MIPNLTHINVYIFRSIMNLSHLKLSSSYSQFLSVHFSVTWKGHMPHSAAATTTTTTWKCCVGIFASRVVQLVVSLLLLLPLPLLVLATPPTRPRIACACAHAWMRRDDISEMIAISTQNLCLAQTFLLRQAYWTCCCCSCCRCCCCFYSCCCCCACCAP